MVNDKALDMVTNMERDRGSAKGASMVPDVVRDKVSEMGTKQNVVSLAQAKRKEGRATRRRNTCSAAKGWHSKQAAQARPEKRDSRRKRSGNATRGKPSCVRGQGAGGPRDEGWVRGAGVGEERKASGLRG